MDSQWSSCTGGFMKFKRLMSIGIILTLMLLTNYGSAAGDIGPFQGADGSNIAPEGSTQVRMKSEKVDIIIQPAVDEDGQDASFAIVKAHFDMQNLGAGTEKMWVEFPLQDATTAAMSGDEIKGFQVKVNGEVVPVRYGSILNDPNSGGPEVTMSIVYFEVIFPTDRVQPVDVTYAIQPSMGEENSQIYRYTLSTGSGWFGTIGQADIIVTFPSEIRPEMIIENQTGSQLDGQQLLWSKTDFEPGEKDNYSIKIQPPLQGLDASTVPVLPWNTWIEIGSAQLAIERQPEKWENWKYLADSYSVLATVPCPNCVNREFIDHFADVGMTAYQRSSELNPNQRAPFVGLARLMLLQPDWSSLPEIPKTILNNYIQALQLPSSDDPYFAEIENQNLEAIYKSLQAGLPQGTTVPKPGQDHTTLQPTAAITTLTDPPTTLQPVATIAPTKTSLSSAPAGGRDPLNGWLLGIVVTSAILLIFIVFRFILRK